MDDQLIIVCDNQGSPTGEYISKKEGHTGKGRLHLAICVLLINSQGEVLLQRRKHQIFDDLWDVTGATNNLHQGGKDESFVEATQRCLKEEYDVENVTLEEIGTFNYFAKDGKFAENEHCAIMVGEYDGKISLNLEDAYECKWIKREEFLKDIGKDPSKYTPWCIEAVKILKEKGILA